MTLRLNDEACPVSLDVLGAVYRAKGEVLDTLLDTIPEAARAQLAAYLYGRSHTHTLGLVIAATCRSSMLRQASPLFGDAVYAASRRPIERSDHSTLRAGSPRKVSLAGSFGSLAAAVD